MTDQNTAKRIAGEICDYLLKEGWFDFPFSSSDKEILSSDLVDILSEEGLEPWTPRNNLIPYGVLRNLYPERAKELKKSGGPWDLFSPSGNKWKRASVPFWNDTIVYRQSQGVPFEVLDWSVISDDMNFCAVDEDGAIYFFEEEPRREKTAWHSSGKILDAGPLNPSLIQRGTVPWHEAIHGRPVERAE